jgi:hypothetical protein
MRNEPLILSLLLNLFKFPIDLTAMSLFGD